MTTTTQTSLTPRLHARLSTYATLAGVALAAPALAPSASASIVYSGPVNISIPNNIDGIYFNIITGVSGTSSATVPGYDINPYNNGAGLTFYGAATPSGVLATGTAGTTAVAQRLTGGESISSTPATGFYNQFQTVGTLFQGGGVAFLGVRFLNETISVEDYGWLQITSSAGSGTSLGFPAFITGYAYENTGAAILAGQTAVLEPSTTAALGFGVLTLGAAGVRRWRRQRCAA